MSKKFKHEQIKHGNSRMKNPTEITVATFNKLAQRYQDKYMDLEDYDDTYALFCKNLVSSNARVLELACGPGNVTRALLARLPDLQIVATDLAPQMVELARINNPTAQFAVMDCRDVGGQGKNFDALVCAFGLPYLSRTEAATLIADTVAVLNPGGLLYLSAMEAEETLSGWQTSSTGDQVYIHYHDEVHLRTALARHGFDIIDVRRKPGPAQSSMASSDLFILARLRAVR